MLNNLRPNMFRAIYHERHFSAPKMISFCDFVVTSSVRNKLTRIHNQRLQKAKDYF